ncbi:MAG: AAA-like domain-containing protein [Limnospira sp. PMC 1291.21]|nr:MULTISPECIES: AAA-like domain-containing protein [Limnospira]MDC0839475.1 AAA-like domain-containing protein [Limnoraphis robusta]MDT9305957.1 AAA-like domain-containing protein [Limnospira sp. PMC 1291.21]MDT9316246.1 AAA-like domain-containing protein [Limnospira sp. PMC 1306.21]MDY7053808.1 AAA-like domain-containing protein [Limnospira fusiformis LS22]MDT9178129.1 AAA-like domain-containing protein [Limnospira sp. PMC 1238.20]
MIITMNGKALPILDMEFEYPNDPVPLNSPFYIDHPSIEELAYREIQKPGSVIRIRAPRKMGKSSLLQRILSYGKQNNYYIVNLDLRQTEASILSDLKRFLRWFCANVGHFLNLPSRLDDYWDEDIGSKVSCTIYLKYLLNLIDSPLIITINEVNYLFEYPQVAGEFLPMLRSWHEEAKQSEEMQKLRLVMVHSTEVYIPLKLNQSPFNVGLPIRLPFFTQEQVKDLAKRHGIEDTDGNLVTSLMDMVGGHPYLVRLALYHLVVTPDNDKKSISDRLQKIISEAYTQGGIYHQHLCEQLAILKDQAELLQILQLIVMSNDGIIVEPIAAYKLESLGLVRLEGNQAIASCQLYRQYFKYLYEQGIFNEYSRLHQLEAMNQELEKLANIDDLTQVSNRRFLFSYLEKQWQKHSYTGEVISIILCDIDCFKLYNDTYGHIAGDKCLQKVAKVLQSSLHRSTDIVARYGGEELAIILPETTSTLAVNLAKTIGQNIKLLNIVHKNSLCADKIITLSMGVASIIPQTHINHFYLMQAADEALYQSKNQGRDRITAKDLTITL